MTQPPEGFDQHEPTRRLDPLDDQQTQAYSDPAQQYEPPAATQYQQPPTQSHYYDEPYSQGQPVQGHPDHGQPPADPPKSNTGRTVALSLAIVLALIVIGFVGYRIIDGNGGSSSTTAATSSETTESTTEPTESTTESTESTTESTSTTPTSSDAVPVGQVTYQITGDGDVVGLRYRTIGGSQFLAAVGSPWQQTTKVSQGRADMSAIVIRGKLTCTISRGDHILSSSTSAGGTLQCSATLPSS
ncbi:hypothetical protein HH308_14730 [Gordonia sp. TBRC 11910]|uniref:MmpS family membrane protein n=1 Tax=Gordonia asplenii TaxID=2725283 RepID=A0A848L1S7_9ACTN|nr:hypothetical protein [Gordonia asplenii]NMO02471.1 hypothetical protein [Gordonia asplenii]